MKRSPPAEARRLVERFEWRYTPKHGSWLNQAESEIGVLSGAPPKRPTRQGQLAIHNLERTHQTQASLPYLAMRLFTIETVDEDCVIDTKAPTTGYNGPFHVTTTDGATHEVYIRSNGMHLTQARVARPLCGGGLMKPPARRDRS
jgi:hypothetical protein